MRKLFHKKSSRVIAVVSAIALAVTALAIGITATLAVKNDITVTLDRENGYRVVEKGTYNDRTVLGANDAETGNGDIATVDLFGSTMRVHGMSAGTVSVMAGSKVGLVLPYNYQITDMDNVGAYILKQGGEVYFSGPGKTKTCPVEVTQGLQTRIRWKSLDTSVAAVAANGHITSVGKGAAIILGQFTDKWGIDRDIHILVGVGVTLNSSDLSELLELVQKGESILNDNPDQYTTESLEDLKDAVNKGKGVLDSNNPEANVIADAVKDLQDAINGMDKKPQRPEDVFGPDKDGNYYHPVGDPPNVYEVVDQDGNGRQPPEYVYNPGDPVEDCENNRPSYPNNGFYYVEDPDGSNIWKPVDKNGDLNNNRPIWGGPDGRPGGGDDKPVTQFNDGSYWVHVGQNVWQKIDKLTLGPLTGGGPDENPVTTPATPIVKNGDKYYVGPINPGPDEYYYGDKQQGGDGLLNSTANILHPTDEKYYLIDGKMVNKKPITESGPGNGVDGKILPAEKAGDSSDWIEIARNGGYSLIIRKNYINIQSQSSHYGDPAWQQTSYGSTKNYNTSTARDKINEWFRGTAASAADNLGANANLRNHTVKNNAANTLGSGTVPSGYNDGFSKPIAEPDRTGLDVAFALSYGEAANYISKRYDWDGGASAESSQLAKNNFAKIVIPAGDKTHDSLWLRSPGNQTRSPFTACELDYTGRVFQKYIDGFNGEYGLIYPALWVNSAIFD
ncbi:MAG: FIVAR domain-containing protein [Oscillospiraceae bacterium]|nr:FIVAR domain-containing protein [Oscillospiraceae bacterium]